MVERVARIPSHGFRARAHAGAPPARSVLGARGRDEPQAGRRRARDFLGDSLAAHRGGNRAGGPLVAAVGTRSRARDRAWPRCHLWRNQAMARGPIPRAGSPLARRWLGSALDRGG